MADQQKWNMDFGSLGTSYDKKLNLDPPGYDAQAARDPVRSTTQHAARRC